MVARRDPERDTVKLSKDSDKPEGRKVATLRGYELWRLYGKGSGGTLYLVCDWEGERTYLSVGGVMDADPENMESLVDVAEEEARALHAEFLEFG